MNSCLVRHFILFHSHLVFVYVYVIQRFLRQVLTPLSKGLNARIELEKKTEKECKSLLERHTRKLDELTVECKQVSMSGLERLCFT